MMLGAAALAIGLVLGIALPTLACLFPRSIFVGLVEAITIWSITMPTFSIGIVCVIVFAVWLHWIPAIGNFVVPALILGIDIAGTLAKLLYEDMKDDRVRRISSAPPAPRGSATRASSLRHVLPNALDRGHRAGRPDAGGVFTGAITMEVVFGLPGLGTHDAAGHQGSRLSGRAGHHHLARLRRHLRQPRHRHHPETSSIPA